MMMVDGNGNDVCPCSICMILAMIAKCNVFKSLAACGSGSKLEAQAELPGNKIGNKICNKICTDSSAKPKSTLKFAFPSQPSFGASSFAMLKLLSRQALKALRNPFRNPLPNPLYGPLQTRHLHTELAPFSGPPSYATLARRFSASSPSPIGFFRRKAEQEAIERGEFVDIHDIAGVDPKDYDVLITDIDNDTLHSEISKLLGIPYLKEATKDEADMMPTKLHGFTYGQTFRMIFPCILGCEDQARWVFFVMDSAAPLTYISTQVSVHPREECLN